MRGSLSSFFDSNQLLPHPGSRSSKSSLPLLAGMAFAVAGTCGLVQPVSAEMLDLESVNDDVPLHASSREQVTSITQFSDIYPTEWRLTKSITPCLLLEMACSFSVSLCFPSRNCWPEGCFECTDLQALNWV